MGTFKKKISFRDSETGALIKKALRHMETDNAYFTKSMYNSNESLYPDHDMSFVEKHMHYLHTHPNVNPQQYLSNLRLMTRVRQR